MKAINKDGYIIAICLNNLKQGKIPRIFSKNNPYSLENIKIWIVKNNFNFKLISDKFEDIKQKLVFKTDEGYLFYNNMDNLIQTNGGYSLFEKSNPYTIHNIKLFLKINNKNFELVSNKYINNNKKMLWNCPIHGSFEKNWGSISQGQGCPKCSKERIKESLKLTLSEVYKIIMDKGYNPLFNYYNNSREKHTIQSKEGYLIYTSMDDFKKVKDNNMSFFYKFNPYTIYNINLYLKINNIDIQLLSDEYKDKNYKMKWKCKNGHIFKMSWDNFYQGQRCKKCYRDSHMGENHPNYNPNKTDEERILGRYKLYGENEEKWRIQIFIRDNRICQYCGQKKNKINAHHLDGWNWCIGKRFDINNGVTLCEDCHKSFHKLYGRGNNTKEQYDDWIKNKEKLIKIV